MGLARRVMLTNPQTWAEARWPFPHPARIRDRGTHTDPEGRTYARLSTAEVEQLDLSAHRQWWWVIYPRRGSADALEVGNRVEVLKRRVVDVAVDIMLRRKVSVVALA